MASEYAINVAMSGNAITNLFESKESKRRKAGIDIDIADLYTDKGRRTHETDRQSRQDVYRWAAHEGRDRCRIYKGTGEEIEYLEVKS